MPENRASLRALSARTLVAAATTVAVVGVVALAWAVIDVLLLVFAGLLFAVLLSAIAGAIVRWTGMGMSAALGLTVLVLVAALAVTAWGLWPSVSEQTDQMVQVLPAALAELRGWLEGRAWGAWLIANAAPTDAVDARALVTGRPGPCRPRAASWRRCSSSSSSGSTCQPSPISTAAASSASYRSVAAREPTRCCARSHRCSAGGCSGP